MSHITQQFVTSHDFVLRSRDLFPFLVTVGELLPEVHNVWSPLTYRLVDVSIPVRMKVKLYTKEFAF